MGNGQIDSWWVVKRNNIILWHEASYHLYGYLPKYPIFASPRYITNEDNKCIYIWMNLTLNLWELSLLYVCGRDG